MNFVAEAALLGFPLLAVVLYWLLPARRAMLACFTLGWLFLPWGAWTIPGVPDYNRISAVTVTTLVLSLAFDSARVLRFRPSWIDIPIAAYCLVPFATASTGGLGMYEGFSHALDQVVEWGIPYFLGRVYFTEPGAIRDLALAVFLAGVVYAPLCLWEAKMSPRLHEILYGFQAHPDWQQVVRMGGWRPQAFLVHGLATGMVMAMGTLVGAWLWASGAIRALRGFPMWGVVPVLVGTTLLCRSTLASVLMIAGLGVLAWMRATRVRLVVLALILAPPAYIYARTAANWDASALVAAARIVSEDRAQSLEARLASEDVLWAHAREKKVFGWGRSNSRPQDEEGRDQGVQDGYWIIAAGTTGLAGLSALMGTILLPALVAWRRLPGALWARAAFAPVGALACVLSLVMCDNVMNAMYNPVWILSAGGVAGSAIALGRGFGSARPGRAGEARQGLGSRRA